MPTLICYTETPPEHVASQVIDMATEYLTDIALSAIPSSNALYPAHQAAMAVEIGTYLYGIGRSSEARVELIVACDDLHPSKVLGFLLYLPLKGSLEACGVTYMAVLKSRRGEGVARSMIALMLERYPHAELSCPIPKVPFYESLGFQVIGVYVTQVRMNTREKSADSVMGVLDMGRVFGHESVVFEKHKQTQKYGVRAMNDAEKQLKRLRDQLSRKANLFVAERLDGVTVDLQCGMYTGQKNV